MRPTSASTVPPAPAFGVPAPLLLAGAGRVDQWLLVTLIALVVVRLLEFMPTPVLRLRPALILTVGTVVFLWSRHSPTHRRVLLSAPLFKLAVGYLLWAVLTVPFALWPGGALDTSRALLVGVLLLLAILLARTDPRQTFEALSATIVLSAAAYAVLLFASGVEIAPDRFEVGQSFDPNDAAAVFAVAVVLALGRMRRSSGATGLLWGALVVLLALGIVRTGSRGGTLALIAGVVIFILGLRGGRQVKYWILALALAFGAWQFAPDTYRGRMRALAAGEQDYNYTAYEGRKQIWSRGWGYYLRNPITGVGAGNFGVAEGDLLAVQGRTGKWSAPHNSYMQAFAELGTLGGLLFLGMLGLTFRVGVRVWRESRRSGFHRPELLAALAAFAVASYFLTNAYSYMFFTLFGAAALLQRALALVPPGTDQLATDAFEARRRTRSGYRPGVLGVGMHHNRS